MNGWLNFPVDLKVWHFTKDERSTNGYASVYKFQRI